MSAVVLWVMLVAGGNPNPFIMGAWWDSDAEEICRHNTEAYNNHHHYPLFAQCIKYTAAY